MPPRHLPVLDGWRGCAILLVLIGHFATSRGINLGRFGVEFFFVLSGRLMAEILFDRATPLTTFFVRRASRIYPALTCFVLAMSVLAIASGHGRQIYGCLAALTLTYNYYHVWFGEVPSVDHIWSLCVEEHSYILLGLIALVWRRFAFPLFPVIAALAALACLDGLVSTLIGADYTAVYWRSDVRGASILLGAAAYLKFGRGDPTRRKPSWRPALLLLVGLLMNVNIVPDPIKYSLGTALLAAAVATIPRAPAALRKGLTSTPLLLFGAWSYSIYLWQQPFYVLHEAMGSWISSAFALLAIATGIASLFLIERPMRGYLNRLFEHAQAGRHEGRIETIAAS